MRIAAPLSGALLAGTTLPIWLGPLAFVGLAPLLWALLRGPSLGRAFRGGWLTGLIFFGVGFSWTLGSTVAVGLAMPVIYAAVVPLLACGIGLFALLVAWLARGRPWLGLAAAPGLWVGFEFARSQEWLAAIPLLHLGYGVADVPALAQGASWFGVYGLSAWMVAVSAALVGASHVGPRARFALVATLALPLAPGVVGGERGDDALRIAAVQPAIDEAERHVPERLHANLGRLLELTEDALDAPADLLAWPESAWERALGPAGDAFLAAIAHDLGTPLVTGAWQVPAAGRADWRNTAVLATAEGRATVVAEKVHPVPVYERAPDGPITNALARAGLWSGRFGPGDPSAPLTVSRANRAPAALGVLVCIDTSHPELARALRRGGARLLVAIANEAGSGGWSATLQARAARLRAIENRVPVLRVANTGPTLWIDARGHVVAALAAGAPGAAAHTLSLAGAPPPFVAIGDRGVVAAWLSSALAIGAVRVLRKRDHSRGIDR